MTTGSDILAADFVAIQDKAESILGTGSGSKGYGQTVQSSDVSIGNIITKAQWDALRYDIVNIRYHQDGVLPNIITINRGDPIEFGAGAPNTNYNTLVETAITNRFRIATNQLILSPAGSVSTSASWTSSASCVATITFNNATDARYFFNSGGKIRIAALLEDGNNTAQVTAWKNIFTSVGSRDFGADTDPNVNYYRMTSSYQTYYQTSLSTPYSANSFRLEARTNVSDNSLGTATVLNIRLTLTDNYADPGSPPPGDLVNGTLTISLEELKAFGELLPAGTGSFSITSPEYSLSAISTS
jgi:hypothetical protein